MHMVEIVTIKNWAKAFEKKEKLSEDDHDLDNESLLMMMIELWTRKYLMMMTIRNRAKALKKKESTGEEGLARKADQEPVFPQVVSTKKGSQTLHNNRHCIV